MTTANRFKLLLSSPFLLLLLFAFNQVKVFGQGTKITPDCVVFVNVTLAAQTTVAVPTTPTAGGAGDNRTEGCQSWLLEYQANGTGALTSVDFQAGESSTTTVTFATWAGTVSTGINPNTSSTGATSTFATGCVNMAACMIPNSWVRVLITRGTFVGTINGVLYGYKTGPQLNVSATIVNSSCPGTVAVPCVVVGPTAAGSAPTTSPVLAAGQDGAPGSIRTVKTDSAGQLIPANASSAGADAVSNTEATQTGAAGGILYPRVFALVFNGTTWDRARGNTSGSSPSNASSALADAISNTNLGLTDVAGTQIYSRSLGHLFNGTSWDRVRGTTAGLFVQGPVASAVANAGNPVKIGAPFNTTQPTFTNGQMGDGQLSPRGALIVVPGVEGFPVTATTVPPGTATAQADGATNAPVVPTVTAGAAETVPNYPYKFNGATWDRDFNCPNQADITLSAATDAIIISGVMSTNVRICHISFIGATTADVTIRQGTGSTCGTNTVALAGAYSTVLGLALDFGSVGALRTTVAARDVCLHFSTSVTVGGVVTYAQF